MRIHRIEIKQVEFCNNLFLIAVAKNLFKVRWRDKTSRILQQLVFNSSCQKPVQGQMKSFQVTLLWEFDEECQQLFKKHLMIIDIKWFPTNGRWLRFQTIWSSSINENYLGKFVGFFHILVSFRTIYQNLHMQNWQIIDMWTVRKEDICTQKSALCDLHCLFTLQLRYWEHFALIFLF